MIGLNVSASAGWLILLAIAWTLPWKAYALWLSARNNQPWWFIVLLILNTLAILEIIYIFAIGRPKMKEREAGSSSVTAK